jgi:hypothetical protein
MCGDYDVNEVKVPVAYFTMQGVSRRRDVDYHIFNRFGGGPIRSSYLFVEEPK